MPIYNYKCDHEHIFSVKMSMADDGNLNVNCPICGLLCSKTLEGITVQGYVKGNGYLDKVGAMRDMNRFTLKQGDPYSSMRAKGEKDDLLKRLGEKIEDATALKKSKEDTIYKVCKSCQKTLPCVVFDCGTKSRCIDCTPVDEREIKKPLYERDVELYLKSKIKQREETNNSLKKQFEQEFGLGVDNIDANPDAI